MHLIVVVKNVLAIMIQINAILSYVTCIINYVLITFCKFYKTR